MIASTTRGEESASPTPVIPSSVSISTMQASCELSALASSTAGSARVWTTTSVISMPRTRQPPG